MTSNKYQNPNNILINIPIETGYGLPMTYKMSNDVHFKCNQGLKDNMIVEFLSENNYAPLNCFDKTMIMSFSIRDLKKYKYII